MGQEAVRPSSRPVRGDRPTIRFGPPVADACALRSLLDGLRGALSATTSVSAGAGSATYPEETHALVSRLRDLLGGLKAIDPLLLRAVPTSAPPAFAEVERLQATLAGIQLGWKRHVQSRFEGAKGGALWGLKDRQGVEILTVMNKLDNENAHSDVIRWLLDPLAARNVAPAALMKLAERLDHPEEWKSRISQAIDRGALAVRREVVIGVDGEDPSALDRVDLVVSGPGLLLAIENKVWSHEHDSQTETYARWFEGFRPERIVGGLFLTPGGEMPESSLFRPLSYVDLLDCLLEGPSTRKLDPREALVLSGYVKSLAASVLRGYLKHLQERHPAMRELSEVTYLMASGAADLDKARERFGWEIQEFVRDLVVEARREPALLAERRMRVDLSRAVRGGRKFARTSSCPSDRSRPTRPLSRLQSPYCEATIGLGWVDPTEGYGARRGDGSRRELVRRLQLG